MKDWYSILSLDGGGMRGIYTLGVIKNFKEKIVDFNLLVGTSTGGIIALALASGRDCEEIASWYLARAKQIFNRNFGYRLSSLFGLRLGRYPNKGLVEACKSFFGEARLKDLNQRVIVTGYETTNADCCIIDSADPKWWNMFVWEAAVITSSAPTYFPSWNSNNEGVNPEYDFVDGGIFAGSPAKVGHAEGKKFAKEFDDKIYLLNIGTGYQYAKYKVRNWGIKDWILHDEGSPISEVIMQAVKKTDHYHLNKIADEKFIFRVIDRELDKSVKMNETKEDVLGNLYQIGLSEVEKVSKAFQGL